MDETRFDALSQFVARLTERTALPPTRPGRAQTRRFVLGGIVGAAVGAIFVTEEIGARSKRGKKKKKKGAASKPCVPACPGPFVCKGGDCVCPTGREECQATCCAPNERCKDGECAPTQCLEPCPGEKVCEDGVCKCPNDRNECRDNVCCGEGVICSSGQCASCTPANCGEAICGSVQNACGEKTVCGACQEEEVCLLGKCVLQCPPEHRVCDGECFPEAFCCSDAECVGNLRCIGGICGCADGRVECNGRCCGDREDCIDVVCRRFECEKEFSQRLAYCGPYPYNCCPSEHMMCCNRVAGMLNVCCVRDTAICCAAPGGCCDRG